MCIIYGNFRSLSFSLSSLGTVSTRHRSLSNSTVGHHRQNSADIRPSLNLINASRNLISRVESSWSENQCIRRERTRKRSNFFQILLGIDYIIIDRYSFSPSHPLSNHDSAMTERLSLNERRERLSMHILTRACLSNFRLEKWRTQRCFFFFYHTYKLSILIKNDMISLFFRIIQS